MCRFYSREFEPSHTGGCMRVFFSFFRYCEAAAYRQPDDPGWSATATNRP